MQFDESYFKAREDAVRCLRRDPERRDYAEGITLLERMRFKPLLTHRLKLCPNHPPMMRILVQAVTDGVNVYRNPAAPKFADTIPAEVEEMTGGTLPPAPDEEESEEDDTSRPSSPSSDRFRADALHHFPLFQPLPCPASLLQPRHFVRYLHLFRMLPCHGSP